MTEKEWLLTEGGAFQVAMACDIGPWYTVRFPGGDPVTVSGPYVTKAEARAVAALERVEHAAPTFTMNAQTLAFWHDRQALPTRHGTNPATQGSYAKPVNRRWSGLVSRGGYVGLRREGPRRARRGASVRYRLAHCPGFVPPV